MIVLSYSLVFQSDVVSRDIPGYGACIQLFAIVFRWGNMRSSAIKWITLALSLGTDVNERDGELKNRDDIYQN
jgi:hypothetical protein